MLKDSSCPNSTELPTTTTEIPLFTHLEEVCVPERGGEAEDVVPLGVLRYGLQERIIVLARSKLNFMTSTVIH